MSEPITAPGRELLSYLLHSDETSSDDRARAIVLAIEAEAVAAYRKELAEQVRELPQSVDPREFPSTGDVLVSDFVHVYRAAVLRLIEPGDGGVIRAASLTVVTAEQAALGLAWERVEKALPAGWRLAVQRTDEDYAVWAARAVSPVFFEGEDDDDYRDGNGPSPAAALSALADALEGTP